MTGQVGLEQGGTPLGSEETALALTQNEKAATGTAAAPASTGNYTPGAMETTDPPSYNLCFDWHNTSKTAVHGSLLTPGLCPRTVREVWQIRMAPAVWSDGTPRRASYICIFKSRVTVLPEGDPRPDLISVFALLETDTCELSHPDWPHWSGRIRVESGTASAFEDTLDHSTRTLVVPYAGNDCEDPLATSMTQSRWTSPRTGWGQQATLSWPHAPQELDCPSFDTEVLQRLRLAGIHEWMVC